MVRARSPEPPRLTRALVDQLVLALLEVRKHSRLIPLPGARRWLNVAIHVARALRPSLPEE